MGQYSRPIHRSNGQNGFCGVGSGHKTLSAVVIYTYLPAAADWRHPRLMHNNKATSQQRTWILQCRCPVFEEETLLSAGCFVGLRSNTSPGIICTVAVPGPRWTTSLRPWVSPGMHSTCEPPKSDEPPTQTWKTPPAPNPFLTHGLCSPPLLGCFFYTFSPISLPLSCKPPSLLQIK
jgi:hypothetical protein